MILAGETWEVKEELENIHIYDRGCLKTRHPLFVYSIEYNFVRLQTFLVYSKIFDSPEVKIERTGKNSLF